MHLLRLRRKHQASSCPTSCPIQHPLLVVSVSLKPPVECDMFQPDEMAIALFTAITTRNLLLEFKPALPGASLKLSLLNDRIGLCLAYLWRSCQF